MTGPSEREAGKELEGSARSALVDGLPESGSLLLHDSVAWHASRSDFNGVSLLFLSVSIIGLKVFSLSACHPFLRRFEDGDEESGGKAASDDVRLMLRGEE